MPESLQEFKKMQKQYTHEKLMEQSSGTPDHLHKKRRADNRSSKRLTLGELKDAKQQQISRFKNLKMESDECGSSDSRMLGQNDQLDKSNSYCDKADYDKLDNLEEDQIQSNANTQRQAMYDTDYLYENNHLIDQEKLINKMKKYTLAVF